MPLMCWHRTSWLAVEHDYGGYAVEIDSSDADAAAGGGG